MQQRLRDWLEQGPFTLVLSSGFFGFYAHTGVLDALLATGHRPSRVSGCSAGALAGGAWAAGVETEALIERLHALQRADFWDPGWGPGFLRGARFRAVLDELLPVQTFAQCRVPLRVSVFDLLALRTRVLDAGPLAPAIQASCTVPLMFHPVRQDGRWLVDGGVLDRPGLLGLPAGERVLYHHIPSRLPWGATRAFLRRDVPRLPGMVSVVFSRLPRSDPFRMHEGRRAMLIARDEMSRALDCPIEGGLVIS